MSSSDGLSIRFIVFVSGAVVMGVEITASRLLAPYYGDTVYVWGSLIAVIMTALAIGYRRGGAKADKYSSLFGLTNIVFVAGIFIVMIPLFAPFVLELTHKIGLPPIYEPLLPSAILLSVPTIYLGMVGPYALRLSAKNLGEIGGVSGGLSSLNTLGGIVGTFLTVFILVPNFGTREIITGMGVVLTAVSIINHGRTHFFTVVLLLVILLIPGNILFGRVIVLGSGSTVYSAETPYSSLSVVDNRRGDVRTMYLNNVPHSAMYLNESVIPVYRYTDYFNLAFGYNKNISRVLFIGGGGFSGPKQFLEDYPWISVDVVEIDPDVVEVAHRYFRVPDSDPRLSIFVMDGRKFLGEAGVYDLIVLDAYTHTYVPFHLMTDEFMELVDSHLSKDGVLVANIIGSLVGDTSELLWSMVVTTRQNIPYVGLYKTRDIPSSIVQNICMIASKQEVQQDKINVNLEFAANPRHIGYLDYRYEGDFSMNALILRDNFAPVEDMLNPVTLTSYDRLGRLEYENYLNPLFVALLWAVSLGGLFIVSRRMSAKKEIDGSFQPV
jgi:spermidine synthase